MKNGQDEHFAPVITLPEETLSVVEEADPKERAVAAQRSRRRPKTARRKESGEKDTHRVGASTPPGCF